MQVIYAWAKNAPKLVLPEEVAFKIGGQTEVQYLVLQVHYASVESFKGDENYGFFRISNYSFLFNRWFQR